MFAIVVFKFTKKFPDQFKIFKTFFFQQKHEKLKLSEKLRAKKKEVEIDETKEEMKIFGSKINKNVFGSEMKIISLK